MSNQYFSHYFVFLFSKVSYDKAKTLTLKQAYYSLIENNVSGVQWHISTTNLIEDNKLLQIKIKLN